MSTRTKKNTKAKAKDKAKPKVQKKRTKKVQKPETDNDTSQKICFSIEMTAEELFGENLDKIISASTLQEFLDELKVISKENKQKSKETTKKSSSTSAKKTDKEKPKKNVLDDSSRYLENILTEGVRCLNLSEKDKWKQILGVEASSRNLAYQNCTKMIEIAFFTLIFNLIVDLTAVNRSSKDPKKYIQKMCLESVIRSRYNTDSLLT